MQDKHKESLKRREFLKTSAKFGAMASLASLSGFALNACDSKNTESTNKDSIQNLQGTQNAGESQISQNIQGEKMKKVWLVTGCSRGMGKELVLKLLKENYPVIATGRNKQSLEEIFGKENDKFLPIALNVTNEKEVQEVLQKAIAKFGRIDVVVNNAGYTHLATIEEMSDESARELFSVNVFGLLNVTRNVLPIMREQRSGHIFNVSSLGAYNVGPLSGIYCATKHTVKAISETLAMEVKDFGIHITDVKPGFIRTEFFGKSYQTTALKDSPYKNLYDENMKFYMGQDGNQAGSPQKVAELYIKVAEMENPYESLPMGTDSCEGIRNIAARTVKLMDKMKDIAKTTDIEV